MDADKRRKIARLTLGLIYLTAWEEKAITGETIKRAWKGYDFDILDELRKPGSSTPPHRQISLPYGGWGEGGGGGVK